MTHPRPAVLVVDQQSEATRSLVEFLRGQELEALWVHDGAAAHDVLDSRPVDCLVTELHADRIDGLAVMRRALERNPDVCAVVVTSVENTERATEAFRAGAHDFQVKPLHLDRLLAVLQRGLSHQARAARLAEVEGQLDERLALDRLTGSSRSIQRVMEQVRSIAATRSTVLIEGEPGTGKAYVALAIHRNSPRRHQPFIAVACTALAESMVESALFGHERGTHSDAGALDRAGFERADGGTLFLDEIGAVPPRVQAQILRVLQDRSLERGGTDTVKVDVRLIAATQRDLEADVRSGRFRDDLLHRLSVVRIRMPELRERREDIPLLVEAFIREFNRVHGRKASGITRGVLERMKRYSWPGNVRELKNTIEVMVVSVTKRRPLDVSDLPESLRRAEGETRALEITVGMTVEEAERQLIEATLEHTAHDKPRAAGMLGIGLRTLYRKLREYGLR